MSDDRIDVVDKRGNKIGELRRVSPLIPDSFIENAIFWFFTISFLVALLEILAPLLIFLLALGFTVGGVILIYKARAAGLTFWSVLKFGVGAYLLVTGIVQLVDYYTRFNSFEEFMNIDNWNSDYTVQQGSNQKTQSSPGQSDKNWACDVTTRACKEIKPPKPPVSSDANGMGDTHPPATPAKPEPPASEPPPQEQYTPGEAVPAVIEDPDAALATPPADETFCLNQIQIAQSRYSARWREGIPREVYARCADVIARQGGAGGEIAAPPSEVDRPAQEPGLTLSAAPLDLSPQERREYCLKVIQLAKERFGVRWVHHVHPMRRRECRGELLEVVQIDRRICQQMNCDLRQMPTERDVLRP